jgi:hypothetical protein
MRKYIAETKDRSPLTHDKVNIFFEEERGIVVYPNSEDKRGRWFKRGKSPITTTKNGKSLPADVYKIIGDFCSINRIYKSILEIFKDETIDFSVMEKQISEMVDIIYAQKGHLDFCDYKNTPIIINAIIRNERNIKNSKNYFCFLLRSLDSNYNWTVCSNLRSYPGYVTSTLNKFLSDVVNENNFSISSKFNEDSNVVITFEFPAKTPIWSSTQDRDAQSRKYEKEFPYRDAYLFTSYLKKMIDVGLIKNIVMENCETIELPAEHVRIIEEIAKDQCV